MEDKGASKNWKEVVGVLWKLEGCEGRVWTLAWPDLKILTALREEVRMGQWLLLNVQMTDEEAFPRVIDWRPVKPLLATRTSSGNVRVNSFFDFMYKLKVVHISNWSFDHYWFEDGSNFFLDYWFREFSTFPTRYATRTVRYHSQLLYTGLGYTGIRTYRTGDFSHRENLPVCFLQSSICFFTVLVFSVCFLYRISYIPDWKS